MISFNRRTRSSVAAAALLTVLWSSAVAACAQVTNTHFNGTFAMQEGRATTRGHLVATPFSDRRRDRSLDLWLTTAVGSIRIYTTDMTKSLHLIAISDDFRAFAHVHPTLDRAGHFHIDMRFSKAGTWHLFADADPTGVGRQVFRYDVALDATTSGARALAATGTRVRIGPYLVSLQTTSLRRGAENALTVHITKHGQPAHDLHPYLGALAHAVFINAQTLTYAHVHPMELNRAISDKSEMADMPGMRPMEDMSAMPSLKANEPSSPDMLLHVAVRESGAYKMWLQFRGAGDALYVAPFVLYAR